MKKLVLLLFIFLVACNQTIDPLAQEIDMSAYGLDDTEHHFVLIEMEDFMKMMDDQKDGIFYLSNEKCHTCLIATPILEKAAIKADRIIYYLDSYALNDDKEDLKAFLGIDQLTTPHLFLVEDGKVISSIIGIFEDLDHLEKAYIQLLK